MMKVKRNHVAGGHFVDVGNDLFVGDTSQTDNQLRHLVSGKAGRDLALRALDCWLPKRLERLQDRKK